MKGDIAFAGFMLTAEEWRLLDADDRAQLIAVATRRVDADAERPRRFPDGTGKHEIIDFELDSTDLIEIADENRILCLVQQRGLLTNLLFGAFPLGYVAANGDVLVRFSFSVEERNDRCIYPVIASVFGAISDLSAPDFPARYRGP